eukprot:TRINITY_DN2168_c1_g1_i2.p1 TRINITY_DN2168_c1_g1~~TRINITY_DN2168_c1_g1_i2.p1  ORF type:complete len:409 (+),score=130.68 TRINITY_DN2168_c1_g1_i2:3-1229(+)
MGSVLKTLKRKENDGSDEYPKSSLSKEAILNKMMEYIALVDEADHQKYGSNVYTGMAGIAFMFLRLSENSLDPEQKDAYLKKSEIYITKASQYLEFPLTHQDLTFLLGRIGILAMRSVIYPKVGRDDYLEQDVQKILSMMPLVMRKNFTENELMYGRTGYLWTLLFIRRHVTLDTLQLEISDAIKKTVEMVLQQGQANGNEASPLMWRWHGKEYFGAAHGVAGIIFVLLQVENFFKLSSTWKLKIQETVDFLARQRFDSGNYPSSFGNDGDRLVQFCHGAPGLALMFLQLHLEFQVESQVENFQDERYLKLAIEAAEVVFSRGLLEKGMGLCHGIAGNAYVFLHLWKITENPSYLHRCRNFVQFIFQHEIKLKDVPDEPYSLFGGMAGTVCLLSDLIAENPRFPCFCL